jgi:hypothetical protein
MRGKNWKMLPKCCQVIEKFFPFDRPPLRNEFLDEAKRRFTPNNIQKIREALNPPYDFDLEYNLWYAVYYYHAFNHPDAFLELSPKQQTEKIAEVEHKTGVLLSLLREQPGLMADIMDDAKLFVGVETFLERLVKCCQERKSKLPEIKRGRHVEEGQRKFFSCICFIHSEVTGRRPTRKFYRLCYEALIGAISEENTTRIAKYTNREYKDPRLNSNPAAIRLGYNPGT